MEKIISLENESREKTACFTGHRELKHSRNTIEENLRAILESLIHQGYYRFAAGGARGFDALAADTVIKLKEKFPQIQLVLILPFQNQYEKETGWTTKEIEEYHYLKSKASEVIHLQEHYRRGCYYKRNERLVEMSSVCICYQYKFRGGTQYTTSYARQHEIEVINCI